MNKTHKKIITSFCLIFVVIVFTNEFTICQNSKIVKQVTGSGGVLYSYSQNYVHAATAGEVFIGDSYSPNYFLVTGFWSFPSPEPVDVSFADELIFPKEYKLHQNYPNPFNPTTTINYDLPEESIVKIEIFNIVGQRVRSLIQSETELPGYKKAIWDGRNDAGGIVASGAYFYRILITNQKPNAQEGENIFHQTKKMLFLK